MFEDQEDSKHQAKVTDDVDDQRFLRSSNRSSPLIPEANQQKRCQSNQSPTDQEEEEIVRANEQAHRKNKKVHVAEETPEPVIIFHIPCCKNMNQEANARYYHQHDCRQRIKE